jgi:selenocysteine-specific elongation factor
MTIDLGFAWLELPGGATVSVVDVPGHERFIKNMLAGVGGIDAALLVVAADEGPMPQTAEHLAILDLLEIERGLVVLTKRDLVDDEWLELVAEETRERLAGTVLAGAPIVPVSSTTGAGLDDLLRQIEESLAAIGERQAGGRPRLPVDRSFSVAGFGTVVTGTLLGGTLDIGQEVELLPHGLRARVRGLQSHGQKVERAVPGARTAVNLSGIEREQARRGDVLTVPGWLMPTTMLDARLRVVADAPQPIEQNDAVDFFIGAAETPAHITLLDTERLLPGETGWVQLRFGAPMVAAAGDRFIVRQASPSLTVGGGTVIDPHPRRHRRFRGEVIAALETRASGTIEERLRQLVAAGPLELRTIADRLERSLDEGRSVVATEVADGSLVLLGGAASGAIAPNRLVASRDWLARQRDAIVDLLGAFHRAQPLRRGMPKEEVKSRLDPAPGRARSSSSGSDSAPIGRIFDATVQTLVIQGSIADRGSLLALPGHSIALTAEQKRASDAFLAALAAHPNAPPAPAEFDVGHDVLAALAELGQVTRLPDGIVYGAEQLAAIQRETLAIIEREGSITLARFRDHFGSSRKYAQAVLEYFDQQRVTRRVGDARVRGSG